MASTTKTLQLNNTEISELLVEIDLHIKKVNLQKKNALRLSLSIEEVLLRLQERFGIETKVTVLIRKRFGYLDIKISLIGEEYNPLDIYDEFDYNTQLLSRLGLSPTYTYRKGTNIVSIKISKQRDNSVVILILSILAALLIGFLGLKLFPSTLEKIIDQFLLPIRTTILNLLTAVAVPVVFFSVFQGIIGADSINDFGKVGKRMMLRFVIKIAIFTAIAGIIMLPLFSLNPFGNNSITNFSGALQMILDILPETIITPFISGNALQVIVIAIAFGIAVLILDTRADSIKKGSQQISSVLYIIMEWVGKLIPALVFLLILETVWSGNKENLIGLWKPILIIAFLCILMILIEIIFVSIKYKVKPRVIIKKLLPSNIIAFATSCAMSTYSVTTETCEKKLGIGNKISSLGLPIGLVTYMPAISVYYLMILFYGLDQYNLPCSIDWLIIAWITVTLLSIATPPISGGSIACFAILLHQMSIPTEAIAFALAINVIAERFCTVANLSMLELELIASADKANLLDKETLKKNQ